MIVVWKEGGWTKVLQENPTQKYIVSLISRRDNPP
jgi:hypothetical protein